MRFSRAVMLAFVWLLTNPYAATDAAEVVLGAGSFDPLAADPTLPESLRYGSEPSSGVFLVQFAHRIEPARLASVRSLGAELLGYVPENAYLARLPSGVAERLRSRADVRWVGVLQPGWKIAPDLGKRAFADPDRRAASRMRLVVELFPGTDADAVAVRATTLGARLVQIVRIRTPRSTVQRLRLRADREQVEALAYLPEIAWIEQEAEITTRNDDSAWVLQSFAVDSWPLWDRGLHGQQQVVGLIDEPIDMNSCFFRDESNNTPGIHHRKVLAYRSSSGISAAEHGTHTAGTLAGDRLPAGGTGEWGGMAPAALISFGSLWDITGSGVQPSNLYGFLADAHADGARVHSNSWGDDSTDGYTSWSRDIDMFAYDFEDSLVVQAGTNLSSGRSPENAKNGLTVGASKRGTAADERCHGTIGPTSDGRRKPEVLAPGCTIFSARAFYACSTFAQTGTSMATPAVAGTASLVRQYYEEGWYPSGTKTSADALTPSGALVKATVLNSTVDMAGEPGYPTDQEGWGRPLLERALHFAGDIRSLSVIADVRNASGLATGARATYYNEVRSDDEMLKVTLVWTEPPAVLLAGEATVNDLDLEIVSPSGAVYLGNVIDTRTGHSIPGGSPDPRNNVEMVIIPMPEPGGWRIRVIGSAVNEGRQGYALVASGAVDPYAPYPLEHDGHAVQDDGALGNGDGIVDPGETVVMPETLRNNGSDTITSIAAELGVTRPDLVRITRPMATYPDMPPGGARESDVPHYRYTVSPETPCGTELRFELALSSSAGAGGTDFTLTVGCNPLECGGDPAPSAEVAGLRIERSGSSDLRLSWQALAGASGYRVWKSARPDSGTQKFVGSTTGTEIVEPNGAAGLEGWFYQVKATNSCEWEGP